MSATLSSSHGRPSQTRRGEGNVGIVQVPALNVTSTPSSGGASPASGLLSPTSAPGPSMGRRAGSVTSGAPVVASSKTGSQTITPAVGGGQQQQQQQQSGVAASTSATTSTPMAMAPMVHPEPSTPRGHSFNSGPTFGPASHLSTPKNTGLSSARGSFPQPTDPSTPSSSSSSSSSSSFSDSTSSSGHSGSARDVISLSAHTAEMQALREKHQLQITEMQKAFEEARARQERIFESQRRELDRQIYDKVMQTQEEKLAAVRAQVMEDERARIQHLEVELRLAKGALSESRQALKDLDAAANEDRKENFKLRDRVQVLEAILLRKTEDSVNLRSSRMILRQILVSFWVRICRWRKVLSAQMMPQVRENLQMVHSLFSGPLAAHTKHGLSDADLHDIISWLNATDPNRQLGSDGSSGNPKSPSLTHLPNRLPMMPSQTPTLDDALQSRTQILALLSHSVEGMGLVNESLRSLASTATHLTQVVVALTDRNAVLTEQLRSGNASSNGSGSGVNVPRSSPMSPNNPEVYSSPTFQSSALTPSSSASASSAYYSAAAYGPDNSSSSSPSSSSSSSSAAVFGPGSPRRPRTSQQSQPTLLPRVATASSAAYKAPPASLPETIPAEGMIMSAAQVRAMKTTNMINATATATSGSSRGPSQQQGSTRGVGWR